MLHYTVSSLFLRHCSIALHNPTVSYSTLLKTSVESRRVLFPLLWSSSTMYKVGRTKECETDNDYVYMFTLSWYRNSTLKRKFISEKRPD
jgi:hypothetical protein